MFDKISAHEYVSRVVQQCHQMILTGADTLFDPDRLSARFAEILKEAEVRIPSLDFAKREGRRHKRPFVGRDGREYERDTIDVVIPYSGDTVAFEICPSTRSLGPRGHVANSRITLSFDDDERLEQNLQQMVEQIEGNLRNLAADLKTLPAQIQSAMDAAAKKRIAQIEHKRDLDAKRSFPIR